MREIKFRVWHNDLCIMDYKGKLVTNYIFENASIGDVNYFLESTDYFKKMQYTGLKDKNDCEIYEGDIIEFNDFNSLRTGGNNGDNIVKGYVKMYRGTWVIKSDKEYGFYDLWNIYENDSELEILSNIYQNPELLEVK